MGQRVEGKEASRLGPPSLKSYGAVNKLGGGWRAGKPGTLR